LAHYADKLRFGERLIIGANEDFGNGSLNINRLRRREQACQIVKILAIAQAMARERVERLAVIITLLRFSREAVDKRDRRGH
jgi:hypothetical protein